jgi:hypothetical protein
MKISHLVQKLKEENLHKCLSLKPAFCLKRRKEVKNVWHIYSTVENKICHNTRDMLYVMFVLLSMVSFFWNVKVAWDMVRKFKSWSLSHVMNWVSCDAWHLNYLFSPSGKRFGSLKIRWCCPVFHIAITVEQSLTQFDAPLGKSSAIWQDKKHFLSSF